MRKGPKGETAEHPENYETASRRFVAKIEGIPDEILVAPFCEREPFSTVKDKATQAL